jgi:hypothetical protein
MPYDAGRPHAGLGIEGWRRLDAFKGFCDSMEGLDDGKKLEQVMKANPFLKFARNALIAHFKIWVNDLLSLLLFSEQQTSHVVAKYLHPPHAAAEEQEAPI